MTERARITAGAKQTPSVCLVVRYLTVGGLERVVIALANALVARGVSTRLVALGVAPRSPLVTELDDRVDVYVLEGKRTKKFANALQLVDADIVHLHFGDGKIHPLLRFALWRKGRRVLVTYHSNYAHKRNKAANRVDRVLASRAQGIIAVSESVRGFCVRDVKLKRERVRVIPNAIPATLNVDDRTRGDVPNDELRIISLAGLYPHKNQIVLLRGVQQARLRGLNVVLTIVGDGPQMARLHGASRMLKINDYVDWYGAIWRRDLVRPLVRSAHVFVSGSTFEGMPISVLEALREAKPLVLSSIDSHREVAGDAALYFDANDPEQFAERLIDAADSDTYLRLSAASAKRGLLYDFENFVDRHLDAYQFLGQ